MKPQSAVSLALIVAIGATATIAGAWFIQLALGVAPCKLCLVQRIPYYIGVPLAGLTVWQAASRPAGLLTAGLFFALGCAFAAAAAMGLYHAGIEWGLWPGPADCSGRVGPPAQIGDFLKQLETVKVIRCDEVAFRIAGLSLAAWNMIVAAALSLLAFGGAWRSLQPSGT